MGTEENKVVVGRFMNEVAASGRLGVADQGLAPNYVNLAMGVPIPPASNSMVTAKSAAIKEQRIDDEELWPRGTPSSRGSTTF